LDLGGKIVFKESDKVGGSGVLQWMRPGKAYTLRNLCRLMIVLSDNTATRMLVDHIGQKRINNYLAGVGLPHTVVMDPTMLREPPASGINQTTPAEMAYLIVQIKEGHGFSKKSSAEMLSYMKNQRYRWGIWRGVAPGTMVADKTGNLERIFNDAGLVYTRSGNYVLSVFTQGLKKRPARELINQISRIAYEEYTGEKVIPAKKTIKRKLSRRPSAKYRPPSGRRGAVSGRK
jgi:beta-lactamase class A